MNTHLSLLRGRLLGHTVAAAALLFLASGCQTYEQQTAQFAQATKTGGIATAVMQMDKQAEANKGSKDEIIYRLEQGQTLLTAAMSDASSVPSIVPPAAAPKKDEAPVVVPPPSPAEVHAFYFKRAITAFDQAEEKVNAYEEQAKVKVGAELSSLVTNQANLPYRGRSYDKVMMNTYKAIGYLALGEKDKARVELNRAQQRQRDAVEANAKRIAAAQSDAEKAKKGELKDENGKAAAYDSSKALDDPKTGPGLQAALNESTAPMKPYGDYVNPFAVFLDGLFFTVLGEGGSDLERGRKSFERVAAIVPENGYLKDDLAAAASAAEGKAIEGVTYVLFETGTAPSRTQIRLDIPTFIVTSKLAYVGASFPKLVYNSNYLGSLGITAGDQTVNTFPIASMDSVIANDFKNEWPTVVTKTLITTATKAIIQAAVQKEFENRSGMFGGLAAGLVMGAINSATNIADTRTWSSLPKEFQYARLPTPASREITLTAAGGVSQKVALEPGSVNVVYVKSSSPTSPLVVSTFILK